MPWREAFVDATLDWQFLKYEDLAELAELRYAIEYIDNPTVRADLETMQRIFQWEHSHADLHAVVGRDGGGTIVAYAWNHPSPSDAASPTVWLEIGVHPAWRHQQIGQRLVGWSIQRSNQWYQHIKKSHPQHGQLWVECAVDDPSQLKRDLINDGQLVPQRWFTDMRQELGSVPDCPALPAGLRLEPYSQNFEERTRDCHNRAFQSRFGSPPVSRAEWGESLRRSDFRPDWSWVIIDATDSAQPVVGYALNCELVDADEHFKEGWTERIGVRPERQDFALAANLLTASLRSFLAAGCQSAGVGVDTKDLDRAKELFGRLGYECDGAMIVFGNRFG